MTPEQTFVKTLFTEAGRTVVRYPRGYWSKMRERVEIDRDHIRIIDTHPDQPGAVLVDIELDDERRWPRRITYRSICYPFLDKDLLWPIVYTAVARLLKSRARRAQ
jgi:hypothetical protein